MPAPLGEGLCRLALPSHCAPPIIDCGRLMKTSKQAGKQTREDCHGGDDPLALISLKKLEKVGRGAKQVDLKEGKPLCVSSWWKDGDMAC